MKNLNILDKYENVIVLFSIFPDFALNATSCHYLADSRC